MNIWHGGRRQLNKEDEALNQKEQTWRTPGGRAGAEVEQTALVLLAT